MNTIFYNLFSKWIWYYLYNLGSITASIAARVESFESLYQDNWLDSWMSYFYESELLIVINTLSYSKKGRDIKSIVLKFPSDQTISLRIINEKQGYSAGQIISSRAKSRK